MKAPQKQLKVHQHDGSAKVYFAPQLCLWMGNNKQGLSKTHGGCIKFYSSYQMRTPFVILKPQVSAASSANKSANTRMIIVKS
jgi:hypothetical protein